MKRRVYCDICKEKLTNNFAKVEITTPVLNENKKVIFHSRDRVDLCDKCYKKITEYLKKI